MLLFNLGPGPGLNNYRQKILLLTMHNTAYEADRRPYRVTSCERQYTTYTEPMRKAMDGDFAVLFASSFRH